MTPPAAWRWVGTAVLCLACATPVLAQPSSGVSPILSVLDAEPEPHTAGQLADPWEPFNRAMFRFNDDVDQGLLLPWTDAYVTLVPELVRIGVGNFFANAQDAWSAVNNLFQGKFEQSVVMSMRFATNTVLGALNGRSQLLSATKALDAIALDRYSFVRDAFLARRLSLVHDGNPPEAGPKP
jgi:ABC-type transporter lipoprotein component MlaA